MISELNPYTQTGMTLILRVQFGKTKRDPLSAGAEENISKRVKTGSERKVKNSFLSV